jgi:hypothetical protein
VLEAAVAKDAKEAKAIATSSFDAALHKLQDKYASLEALNKRYQQVGDEAVGILSVVGCMSSQKCQGV